MSDEQRLHDRFVRLCEIASPTGDERAVADDVLAELRGLGVEVEEDGAAGPARAGAGNLIARVPGRGEGYVAFFAHLDTVPHDDPIKVDLANGVFRSVGDTILGADNKAAVTVLVELAARAVESGPPPVGLELVFTVAEEDGLRGAKELDVSALRSPFGFVLDHATPIGEIVVASPTYFRLEAAFHGKAAHAGIRPEEGRSAVLAAALAIAAMPLGRIDDQTTANVGSVRGGTGSTNVVPDRCHLLAEARSLDPARVEDVVAKMVDALHDGAAHAECDVDVVCEKLFTGFKVRPSAPELTAAEAALRACGYEPRRIQTGGGSDANALQAAGFPCLNLANGTERNHEATERVSVAALEGMLDVALVLLDEAAAA